jgi:hypothetical protein
MTSLQRLAAVHKQNEVSWHHEVSNKAHRTQEASTSKQLHHKSVTLISRGDTTSLNKLQHVVDPVKYCVQNYSVHKKRKAADVVCFHTGVQHHFVTASLYNITPAQACMTSPLQCIINTQFCIHSMIIFMACLCHNNINTKIQ